MVASSRAYFAPRRTSDAVREQVELVAELLLEVRGRPVLARDHARVRSEWLPASGAAAGSGACSRPVTSVIHASCMSSERVGGRQVEVVSLVEGELEGALEVRELLRDLRVRAAKVHERGHRRRKHLRWAERARVVCGRRGLGLEPGSCEKIGVPVRSGGGRLRRTRVRRSMSIARICVRMTGGKPPARGRRGAGRGPGRRRPGGSPRSEVGE